MHSQTVACCHVKCIDKIISFTMLRSLGIDLYTKIIFCILMACSHLQSTHLWSGHEPGISDHTWLMQPILHLQIEAIHLCLGCWKPTWIMDHWTIPLEWNAGREYNMYWKIISQDARFSVSLWVLSCLLINDCLFLFCSLWLVSQY